MSRHLLLRTASPRRDRLAACTERTYSSLPSALSLEERRPSGIICRTPGRFPGSRTRVQRTLCPDRDLRLPLHQPAKWRLPRSLGPPIGPPEYSGGTAPAPPPLPPFPPMGTPRAPAFFFEAAKRARKKKKQRHKIGKRTARGLWRGPPPVGGLLC